jgi:carbon storage regulator
MLVLTRTLGEEIVIAGNIRVRVSEIKGGRIKLAIEAPRNVAVRRQEIPGAAEAADELAAAR